MRRSVFTPDALAGAFALVVGGTSGIGAAISRALLAVGSTVTATGVTDEEVGEAMAMSDADGFSALRLDITEPGDIARIIQRLHRLDILVNCAGITRRGQEFDLAVFRRVLDVNLTGMMAMCIACQPLLAASGGCITNLASIAVFYGSATLPAYSVSKGGVLQLTRSLAVAWAPQNIRVNAIAPGNITTPMTQANWSDRARSQAIIDATPMKRWGTPEEVAGAVVFLCSPEASFITGALLTIDGGYSLSYGG